MKPIACSLSPAQFTGRAASIRALYDSEVVGVERSPREIVWRFRPDPAVRERFVAMAEAEAECCAFLDFAVEADRLVISAPEGAEGALAEMFG
jgi:hypothetical protein